MIGYGSRDFLEKAPSEPGVSLGFLDLEELDK